MKLQSSNSGEKEIATVQLSLATGKVSRLEGTGRLQS